MAAGMGVPDVTGQDQEGPRLPMSGGLPTCGPCFKKGSLFLVTKVTSSEVVDALFRIWGFLTVQAGQFRKEKPVPRPTGGKRGPRAREVTGQTGCSY